MLGHLGVSIAPGRTQRSTMGTPYDPVTVEPNHHATSNSSVCASCHLRRPGPGYGGLEGVSQPAFPGKYAYHNGHSLDDVSNNFSSTENDDPPASLHQNSYSTSQFHLPGRNVESLTEAPGPSDPVEQIAASVLHSRPGPVVSCGAGVFQSVTSGANWKRANHGASQSTTSHRS